MNLKIIWETVMNNIVEFKVTGNYALFTDPLSKIGGEKCSYQIPTYEALKGILSSVYWKPTFVWIVDRVKVIKEIRTQTRSAKPINFSGGNSLAIYTYLSDVEYYVRAHFEWNHYRNDLTEDRNENKHFFVARRMIDRGGRRDIFLGTRECQAYVEPCEFDAGESYYQDRENPSFDLMFHGFDYPDEIGKDEFHARFWRPKMLKGIVTFIRPEACTIRKLVRTMKSNRPVSTGLAEEGLLEGYKGLEG
jgi:CRISPR-associated protein Cas5d